MKPYRTICVSLYVEQLVAIDAKVQALKDAGHRRASRSQVLALCAMHLPDSELVALMKPSKPRPSKTKRPTAPARRAFASNRCGACGISGHTRRTCTGLENEVRMASSLGGVR